MTYLLMIPMTVCITYIWGRISPDIEALPCWLFGACASFLTIFFLRAANLV